jgi:glycosyltransferase involved in cell wall biosynthesis
VEGITKGPSVELDSPLVSVIIPTYNRAHIVTDAINSVLSQTFNNFQLIIVDDGSTDNTRNVLDTYQDKVEYFYKANGGVSSARNVGLRMAQGKYVAFLDSDDIWHSERLEILVNFMEHNGSYSAVFTDCEGIDGDGNTIDTTRFGELFPGGEPSILFFLEHMFSGFACMCIRSALLEVGEFDETLRTAEDIDYALRLAAHHRIAHIATSLLKIRKCVGSLNSHVFTGNRIVVLRKFKQSHPELARQYRDAINAAFARVHLSYGEDLLWTRHMSEGRAQLLDSLGYRVSFYTLKLLAKSYVLQCWPSR